MLINITSTPEVIPKEISEKSRVHAPSTNHNNLTNDTIRKQKKDKLTLTKLNERGQVLVEENHRYLLSIATLKAKLEEVQGESENLSKNVKMLTSKT